MNERELQKLLNDSTFVGEKVREMQGKSLFVQDVDKEEISGHILKAENQLIQQKLSMTKRKSND